MAAGAFSAANITAPVMDPGGKGHPGRKTISQIRVGSESFTWSGGASKGWLCCYTGTDGTFHPRIPASFPSCIPTWAPGGAAEDLNWTRKRLENCFSFNRTRQILRTFETEEKRKTAFVPRGVGILSNLPDSGRLFHCLKEQTLSAAACDSAASSLVCDTRAVVF